MTFPIIGRAYRLNYGPKNPNNRNLHIRAIVDGDQVVVAWPRGNNRWRYGIESLAFLEGEQDRGFLKLTESKRDPFATESKLKGATNA